MSEIKLTPIEGSSAITHYHYDEAKRELHLMFTNAKQTSVIKDVEPATVRQFLAAKSKGQFFHQYLK